MSESVDGNLQTKNFIEIYTKNETKLTQIPHSLFFVFKMCQNC